MERRVTLSMIFSTRWFDALLLTTVLCSALCTVPFWVPSIAPLCNFLQRVVVVGVGIWLRKQFPRNVPPRYTREFYHGIVGIVMSGFVFAWEIIGSKELPGLWSHDQSPIPSLFICCFLWYWALRSCRRLHEIDEELKPWRR